MIKRLKFESVLKSKDCTDYWLTKTKADICELLGHDVATMVGYDQRNPHHCHDLLTHSLCTVKNLKNKYSEIGEEEMYLLAAAFFHDIGKPTVASVKDDRLVFYGHSSKSAKISEGILSELGYDKDETSIICFYIAHHDDFISYVLPDEEYDLSNPFLIPITKDSIYAHIQSVEEKIASESRWYSRSMWSALALLCMADIEAQAALVYQRGTLVDSMQHKLSKMEAIYDVINSYCLR